MREDETLTGWLLVENRDEKVLLRADMVDGGEDREGSFGRYL